MKETSYGYAGNILRVDLNTSDYSLERTDSYVPKFLGGRGVNQALLFKELPSGVTPFEPANKICFGAGTLVGTLVPGASRLNVDSINVLTGGIGSGSAGGWFASELKFAGFDHIVIQGKAESPVYLWIEDDTVSIRAARDMWGATTSETERMVKADIGQEDIQVLSIGPGGENLVKPSCIVVSGSRVVGRCGLGAVMGSKNLKAIAVKGTGSIKIKDQDRFMEVVDSVSHRIRHLKGAEEMVTYGTLFCSPAYNDLSALTFKNYEDDHVPDEHLRKISHEAFHGIETDRYACTACPLPCSHVYTIENGPYAGTRCHKAEANSVWNFGGRLAMDDVNGILKAQEECCQLGLDIDNTSGVIAWAIDCYQNGLISADDTDGLALDWGDHGTIIELIRKIGYRTGFGNTLAEGSFKASQMVGKGTDRFAFHIKGQDLIEGIRSMKGWALGIVVSPRGAAHTRGALATERSKWSEAESRKTFGTQTAGIATSYDDKAKALMYMEQANAVWDALGICFFTANRSNPDGVNPGELAWFYTLATGIDLSEDELMKAGERLHNLEKMFNVHHAGFTRDDDYPPKRLMEEPIKSGPLKGERLLKKDWDRLLDDYYDCHNWDKQTSWPTREKLKALDLEEYMEALEKKRI